MNRRSCEREEQTSAAMVSGVIDPEFVAHAKHCNDCANILLVGEFLRSDSTLAERECTALSSPDIIWRRAQQRATQRAVRLALRPIRWMTVLACVAFACAPWLGLVLPLARDLTSSWREGLDSNFLALSRMCLVAPNEPLILLAVSGTMFILALSSWLILREQ